MMKFFTLFVLVISLNLNQSSILGTKQRILQKSAPTTDVTSGISTPTRGDTTSSSSPTTPGDTTSSPTSTTTTTPANEQASFTRSSSSTTSVSSVDRGSNTVVVDTTFNPQNNVSNVNITAILNLPEPNNTINYNSGQNRNDERNSSNLSNNQTYSNSSIKPINSNFVDSDSRINQIKNNTFLKIEFLSGDYGFFKENTNSPNFPSDINIDSLFPQKANETNAIPDYLKQVLSKANLLVNDYRLTQNQYLSINKNLVGSLNSTTKSVSNRLISQSQISPDIYKIMNLTIITGSKSKNINILEESKFAVDKLMESITISNLMKGEIFPQGIVTSSFAFQMFPSSLFNSMKNIWLKNGFSMINPISCQQAIQRKYGIKEDLFILKLDYPESIYYSNSSMNQSASVNFRIFNPINGNEFNVKDECPLNPILYNIPFLQNSRFDRLILNNFVKSGWNIFNSKDSLFEDRCIDYINSTTGLADTLNQRRNNLFLNVSCSSECVNLGLDINNYVKCNCSGSSSASVYITNGVLDSLSSVNIDIVFCFISVINNNKFGNLGFIIFAIFVGIMNISLFFFYKFNRNIIDRNLQEILKQDATYYNKETMKEKKEPDSKELKSEENKNKDDTKNDCKESNDIELQKIEDELKGVVRINEKIHKVKVLSIPTIKDLQQLEIDEIIKNDHRNFYDFFTDKLKLQHAFLFAYWRSSLMDPQFVRILNFWLRLCFVFALNALFFTDSEVEKRNEIAKESQSTYLTFQENLLFTIPRSILCTIIDVIILSILTFFMSPPEDRKEELNKCLKTQDSHMIHEGYNVYLKNCQVRFTVFVFLSYFVILFSWYYVICFCGVYEQNAIYWLTGGIISLLTDNFIVQIVLPLLVSSVRSLASNSEIMMKLYRLFLKINL